MILCTRIERLDGFQILTMLKLDPDACNRPVLTYATESEGRRTLSAVLSQWTDGGQSDVFSIAQHRE